MTKSEVKKAIEVMQAYVDGKKIQVKHRTSAALGWFNIEKPDWDWVLDKYRVAPQKEVKPRNSAKVKAQGLHKRLGYDR